MMDRNLPQKADVLIYQTEDGQTRVHVRLEDNTVWLTQTAMTDLFQTTKQNISLHLNNIFKEGELDRQATVKKYLTVQHEAEREIRRQLEYYNLEAIIAVGYRVRSHRGTQFRKWATERLKEYLVKGFTMDDERLKEGRTLGEDYFDELLERIRDIRASEKRFYRKICDIYALSADYETKHPLTQEFFATVQNKMHFAVHGHTAAEIIVERADAKKPNMGLTSWKGVKVRQADVTIAKNYLIEEELRNLNRIVTMYLDYAEDRAEMQQPMYMTDWKEKLDAFLKFNNREILDNPGKVSNEVAEKLALKEYKKYTKKRLIKEAESRNEDFDRFTKRIEGRNEHK